MAIGRSEDRDTPGNPSMLRHRVHVRDPIRVAHLGLRSTRPHTQAGHMTAIDQTHFCCKTLQTGGRPHMGSGLRPLGGPGITVIMQSRRMAGGEFPPSTISNLPAITTEAPFL